MRWVCVAAVLLCMATPAGAEDEATLVNSQVLSTRLATHVEALAGPGIGARNVWAYGNLKAAARYIRAELEAMGYEVTREPYANDHPNAGNREVENLIVEVPGAGEGIVVVGAHYDTAPGTPGADDNASGVAVVLELARALREHRPSRTVRFVFFTCEEPPFFLTGRMGSRVHAARARERGEDITAMLSVESVGFYSDAEGSQQYPFPLLGMFYPTVGNFIGFVGNLSNHGLVNRAHELFARVSDMPAEKLSAPGIVRGVGWSDHWSFWHEGYAAIMVTDSAPYRNPHYHEPTDLPDTLDYARMARVVHGLAGVVRGLSGE